MTFFTKNLMKNLMSLFAVSKDNWKETKNWAN